MNEGVWKSFGFEFDKLSHRGGKLERKIFAPTLKGEIFLNCKGRKIVWGKLFIATSALKSQRRVRCEFGDVGF